MKLTSKYTLISMQDRYIVQLMKQEFCTVKKARLEMNLPQECGVYIRRINVILTSGEDIGTMIPRTVMIHIQTA